MRLLVPAANPCALNVTVSMALCVYCIRRNKIVMITAPSLSYTFKHLCVFSYTRMATESITAIK